MDKVQKPINSEYISSFGKHSSGSIQLEVDAVHLGEPSVAADAFTNICNLSIITIVLWTSPSFVAFRILFSCPYYRFGCLRSHRETKSF
jgi:hypothetical protein